MCQITGLLLVAAADKEVKNKSTSNGSVVAPLGTQLQQLQTISLPKVLLALSFFSFFDLLVGDL